MGSPSPPLKPLEVSLRKRLISLYLECAVLLSQSAIALAYSDLSDERPTRCVNPYWGAPELADSRPFGGCVFCVTSRA